MYKKGKVLPIIGHEDPGGDYRRSSVLPITSVGDQYDCPVTLFPGQIHGTHWVGIGTGRVGYGKSHVHQNSNPILFNL
jgi:hypothetical protein